MIISILQIQRLFMKNLKSLFLILCFQFIFASSLLADQKYIMKSGEEYYGEKIDETSETLVIKESISGTILKIPKENVYSSYVSFVEITTKDGYRTQGTLIESTDDLLILKNKEGILFEIKRSNVSEIDQLDEHSFEDLDDRAFIGEYGDEFAMAGFSIGTPGMVNLVLGYHFDWFTIKAHGGSNGVFSGIQFGLLFNIYETDDNSFSIGLGVATGFWWESEKEMYVDVYKYGNNDEVLKIVRENMQVTDKYYYMGSSIYVRYSGFYLEFGSSDSIMEDIIPRDKQYESLINVGYTVNFDL